MLFEDSDHDGSYAPGEFTGGEDLFNIIDHDKDGSISSAERHAFLSRPEKTSDAAETQEEASKPPPEE
jgi:hypothetical protein